MNEKGFMYPISLCIFLLVSLFLTIEFNQYISEKGIVASVNQQERRQYLFLLTSKKISEEMEGAVIPVDGIATYSDTTVTYTVKQITSQYVEVTFFMTQGTLSIKAIAQYEVGSGKLVKWLLPV
ncbi:hypothetical protein ACFFHF_04050 [Robertmurraya beringensis]|uniref:Competence protein ComGG n=1 Tax=Robertmurraya beringensis TaxID=641660 RepID=A0ABV6KN45_9BACI|nr:Uncharacterised protein [Mycobacteroides abscessus subsp. abscessus]